MPRKAKVKYKNKNKNKNKAKVKVKNLVATSKTVKPYALWKKKWKMC